MHDELDGFDDPPARSPWYVRAAGVVAALGLLVGLGFVVAGLARSSGQAKPHLQQIALLKQPPPPPPKPPEKLPEPPKVKDEVKIDQPKLDAPKPDDAKPADDKPASDKPLGLDADGTAGSDGFGLAANRGGRELLSTGSGGSGRYYTGLLQRNFYEALLRNRKTPLGEFSVVVSVWLADDGRVQRSEIVSSSGNPQTDSLVQATLAEMNPLREVPPSSLRQVQLRLNRRS